MLASSPVSMHIGPEVGTGGAHYIQLAAWESGMDYPISALGGYVGPWPDISLPSCSSAEPLY